MRVRPGEKEHDGQIGLRTTNRGGDAAGCHSLEKAEGRCSDQGVERHGEGNQRSNQQALFRCKSSCRFTRCAYHMLERPRGQIGSTLLAHTGMRDSIAAKRPSLVSERLREERTTMYA